ncbi:hypothetical protein [Candidatus Magnetominusculus xianensis]|uniref:Secreted protein n=1 Tax=Candidatus Magnetominusculus xianensis TaxID=1748249 RepID=A0ABR5SFQ7_9BACT|nr:hypothetical protein [Candidatus Magnetominusculus xianensis]KWT86756.1 hypothetical protein ASN18_1479 [Candidatus Magnetominusculus xianensis]MBF0402525.1 hypothetical protein [Nitrospirota bacterium]
MKRQRLIFIATSFVMFTVLSSFVFNYVPYFDYTEQKADITPIIASGTQRAYEMIDFNPIIDNITPSAMDDCKLKFCGESFNWSMRTYEDVDKYYKITIKITMYKSREKAQKNYDDYVLAIKKNRYDKVAASDGYQVFVSSVKKLRWDFPPTPNGLFASRVLFLKNNIMIDVLETSKSKKGEYKNKFLAGLGRQLMAAAPSGDK